MLINFTFNIRLWHIFSRTSPADFRRMGSGLVCFWPWWGPQLAGKCLQLPCGVQSPPRQTRCWVHSEDRIPVSSHVELSTQPEIKYTVSESTHAYGSQRRDSRHVCLRVWSSTNVFWLICLVFRGSHDSCTVYYSNLTKAAGDADENTLKTSSISKSVTAAA